MHRSHRILHGAIPALILAASSSCGGGGGGDGSSHIIPPEATLAEGNLKAQMIKLAPHVANAQASLMFIVNPDAGLTPGITYQPDNSPGAAPNTYTFDGIYDGNGDGVSETSLTGKITYAGDPTSLQWGPATGQVDIDIDIPVVGHVYHATIDYRVTATEVRISGSGSFTNPVTGETTSVDIPSGSPVVIRSVTAQNNAVGNACGYNLDGTLAMQLSGPTGTLKSDWLFSPNTTSVAVQRVAFTDPSGKETRMADSTTALACGGSGSINDWTAVYDQHWACLPIEHGNAKLTLAATGASVIAIDDEDPPGSGESKSYTASTIGSSMHAVQGYFDGGPVGDRYREHFTWTLGQNGDFSQWSGYTYTEGANSGKGGICAARATRAP